MLSSMTEKMRETADKVERFGHRNRDWLWRDATTITRAVVELRDAADTIDYLRNTCNDLQLENDKLRIERDEWHLEQVHAYGNWEDAYRYADELKSLVRDMWDVALHPQLLGDGSHLRERMSEMGVEVDE